MLNQKLKIKMPRYWWSELLQLLDESMNAHLSESGLGGEHFDELECTDLL